MKIHPSSEDTATLLRYATYAAVTTAVILVLIKSGAWFATDSTSLLASLLDSGLDALASLTNLVAVHYALQPADSEHRFGHGKLEPLAGLGQALLISISGLFLVRTALHQLLHPYPLSHTPIGIAVMIISILATLWLVRLQRRVINATDSTAIRADSLHYATDLLSNAAVLIALTGDQLFGWKYLDPIFALAIALYILYSAWEIAWESGQLLMDRELPENDRELIVRLACQHPQVHGINELKTRRAGTTAFIQFQLEINATISLELAHRVTEEVEKQILEHFPSAEIHIHQEPVLK